MMALSPTFRASTLKVLDDFTELATISSVNEAVPEIFRGLLGSDLSTIGTVYVSWGQAERVRQKDSTTRHPATNCRNRMKTSPATQNGDTFSDCVRLRDRGSSPQGVLRFKAGWSCSSERRLRVMVLPLGTKSQAWRGVADFAWLGLEFCAVGSR